MPLDHDVLRAALVGYQMELHRLEAAIAGVQAQIGGRTLPAASAPAGPANGPKRSMSAAARKRIAEAQRKRWAAFHQAKSGS